MKTKLAKIIMLILLLALVVSCFVACGTKSVKITVMEGETEIESFEIDPGEMLSKKEVLAKLEEKKEGYEFVGLFTDPEMTKEFKYEDAIASEITLYAKFTLKTYFISVKQQDGESEVPKTAVKKGEEYSIPAPTKEGYTFTGYEYMNDDGDYVAFPQTGTYSFSDNVRLFARWTKKLLTVTFKAADEAETVLATQEGIEYGAKASRITLDGYTINGYYLAKEFTDANKITLASYEIKAATTIYVDRTANSYTLTVAGWAAASINVTYGEPYALIAPTDTENAIYTAKIGTGTTQEWATFTGYTYGGNAFAASGTYTYAQNIVVNPVTTPNENYNMATVTFHDTVRNTVFKEVVVARGAKVAGEDFPATQKTGYDFDGWFTTNDYAQGTEFNSNIVIEGATNVYAKYTAHAWTITVKDTDASGAVLATIPVTYGTDFSITEPQKFGYLFDGYLLGTDEFDPEDYAVYDVDGNLVLFATWKADESVGDTNFIKDSEKSFFKERATAADPYTYVFVTGGHYSFDGYTMASSANGTYINIASDGSAFDATAPGEFTLYLTATAGGAQVAVPAKVVYNVVNIQAGASYADMISNAQKSDLFQNNLDDKNSYVMDVGVTGFIPDLYFQRDGYSAISMADANVVLTLGAATGGEFTAGAGKVSWNGTSYSFDNTGNVFTAEENVVLTFKPKYAFNDYSVTTRVKFNTGVNVYTNDELRNAYANTSVSLINVMRNITAVLEQSEYREDGNYGKTKTIDLVPGTYTGENPLTNWDAGTPRNRFGGGVYKRSIQTMGKTSDQISDNVSINGNYFTIDGSRLPYIYETTNRTSDEESAAVGYMLGNVQIGIFMYRCAEYDGTGDYDDMTGMKYSNGNVSFNNLRIVGNNIAALKDAEISKEGHSWKWNMLAMSASFNGITIRGGTLNLDNTTISNVNLGMMLHGSISGQWWPDKALYEATKTTQTQSTKLYMRNSLMQNCWGNDIYAYDIVSIDLRNSRLGGCAGAAITFDDRAYANPAITDKAQIDLAMGATQGFSALNSELRMDTYSAKNLSSMVNGGEPWFIAYGQAANAGTLKTDLEGGVNASGMTIMNGEAFNFAILVNPASGNFSYDQDGGTAINYAEGATILASHNEIAGKTMDLRFFYDPDTDLTGFVDGEPNGTPDGLPDEYEVIGGYLQAYASTSNPQYFASALTTGQGFADVGAFGMHIYISVGLMG